MIDFAAAKQLVAERWLPIAAKRVRSAVAIVDELCVEYEWGWVIHWRPVEPKAPEFVNKYPHPYLADRVTGETGPGGGTLGINRGIVALLQHRPPELCGPYPPGRQSWYDSSDAFRTAGAFTPLGPAVAKRDEAEPSAAADRGGSS